jgi:hypothetical protein
MSGHRVVTDNEGEPYCIRCGASGAALTVPCPNPATDRGRG